MAALLITASNTSAQWDPGFSGYVVTMPAYLRLNPDLAGSSGLDQNQLANVTRLRLRPSLSLPWDALLEIEYEMSGLIQSADQPLLVESKDIGRQVFDLRWTIAEGDHYAVIHFIDRLVYRQRMPVGRRNSSACWQMRVINPVRSPSDQEARDGMSLGKMPGSAMIIPRFTARRMPPPR